MESNLPVPKPEPVDAKEKARRLAAMEYDYEHRTKYLGITREERMETFRNLGYFED